MFIAAIWLVSFRIADSMAVFKTYSSIWFPPSGVTLAVVLAVPGWLKLVPLLANLSLALPGVRQIVGVEVLNDVDPLFHGVRIYLIYGGAGLFLSHVVRIAIPFRNWVDVQWFIGAAIVAALLAAASGLGLHVMSGNMTLAEALTISDSWWFGDALGAVMVPPMLVPALMAVLRLPLGSWRWPSPGVFGMAAVTIFLAALLGAAGPLLGASLWYLVIPPALIFALRGGFEQAACSVLITCILTPVVATLFDATSDAGSLSAPLLIMAIAALLVGAATSERLETAERLEALVARRTGELERAYELQRHLVRSLGHDLRQPVEAINLTLVGIGEAREGAALNAAVDRVRQLGILASDLLSRILIYARLDTGEFRPDITAFPLSEVIDTLRTLYEPQAGRHDVTLTIPQTDLMVETDRELLFQILSNHLDNAIRLTPEGGTVGIVVEAGPAELGIFITDGVEAHQHHLSNRGGLGLQIVSQSARLLGARTIEEPNRRGIILVLPPKR